MKKIPTALVRNPDDRAHVLMEINADCEWVFAGEGRATRKLLNSLDQKSDDDEDDA